MAKPKTVACKPAATAAAGLSHTLRKAVSSRYPTPLPWHLRTLAWVLALAIPSCFYLGPLMLLAPPFLYLWHPSAALALLVMDVVLVTWPEREWPWFRGVFQLWLVANSRLLDCIHQDTLSLLC